MRYLAALITTTILFTPGHAANISRAPDGSSTYRCGDEKQTAMGCFNYWVKFQSPDLPNANRTSNGKWIAASCSSSAKTGGLCYQGGVSWWYWKQGAIGGNELKGFTARDYSLAGNDNMLGTAVKIRGQKGCYGVADRSYCMVQMVEQ